MGLNVPDRIDLALQLWESIPDKDTNITISSRDQKELTQRYEEHLNEPQSGRTWDEIKSTFKNRN